MTSKRVVLAAALICLAGYVYTFASGRAGVPIRSDGFNYYVYLPSWFIYGDATLSSVARDCCGGEFPPFTMIVRWPDTGRWINAHPIGVAAMQSPFFLMAHALTKWSNLSPDGFSLYYQHAVGLAGLLWTVAGLYVLRRVLLRHYSDGVTAVTLATLLVGTNLFHYATFDSSYSHAYSFFLVAALMDLTERIHSQADWTDSVLLGLVAGLIILTRHTNALVLLVLPLYGVTDYATLKSARSRLAANWRALAVIIAVAIVLLLPQFLIYYQATGRLFVNSYGDVRFNFLSPRLFGVLFSVTKGLFFWAPLLLAAVAGLFMIRGSARAFVTGAAVFLVLHAYLVASWWDWQFGAGYGHRGFIDAFPLLAIGLAEFFAWSSSQPRRTLAVTIVVCVASGLSMFQTLQYWNGALPMTDVTWSDYRALFLSKP